MAAMQTSARIGRAFIATPKTAIASIPINAYPNRLSIIPRSFPQTLKNRPVSLKNRITKSIVKRMPMESPPEVTTGSRIFIKVRLDRIHGFQNRSACVMQGQSGARCWIGALPDPISRLLSYSSENSALYVSSFTTPLASRLLFFWNAAIALSVPGPNCPSADPESTPSSMSFS